MSEHAFSPTKVPSNQADVHSETPRFHVSVLIDREKVGSELLLGVVRMDSGKDPISWQAPEDTHEAYYVQHGRLRVTWDGPDPGDEELRPHDAFYFPPGRRYTLENVGQDEILLIYSVAPSPA